ncbi:MAG TPA: hypothetical protein VFI65_17180 [Streptosporangiaceae bacterium]|nr:hypothetical protein [Streptosporangiaceae bacterium]
MSMMTVGTASAAAPNQSYTTNVLGPISTQAACNADSAAANDPPDTWTSACRFSATYPGTSVSDPGWYYNIHILIG